MRILHVTPYYEEAWAYGGIPRVAGALARGLERRGHRVTVCATDAYRAGARLPVDRRAGGPVALRIFPNLSNALAYHWQLFLPLGLDGWLRRHAREFDVAHLHACRNLPGALAACRLGRARVPFVVEPHGTAPRIERRFAAKWIYDHTISGGGRGELVGAARVIAVSRAEERQLAGLGVPREKLRLLENPVEVDSPPERGRFRARFSLPWPELVLYLGKLTPRKRLDVLVEAFAAVARPSVGLVIAGPDMGARRALEPVIARLGLGDRVRFTGLLEGGARLEALADADVVAYPSEHEVFGLVPVEALLCGTPVIVAGDSGAGEVIGETGGGLIVPAAEAPALADAIQQILDEPARWRAAAAAAAERARARYATDVVCARLEAIYREVIATHPALRPGAHDG